LKPNVTLACRGDVSVTATVTCFTLSPAAGVTTSARAMAGDWKSRRSLSSTASRVYSSPGRSSSARRSVSSSSMSLPSNRTSPTRVSQRGSTSMATGTTRAALAGGMVVSIRASP
jgi:hypothetical protein